MSRKEGNTKSKGPKVKVAGIHGIETKMANTKAKMASVSRLTLSTSWLVVNVKKLRNNMKQKDLAEEYAIKEYKRLVNRAYIVKNNRSFTFDDIKAAFNAGRESVVENMPDLKWQCVGEYNLSDMPFGRYYIDPYDGHLLRFNGLNIPIVIGSCLKQNKQAANEDYKKRIKQALGL